MQYHVLDLSLTKIRKRKQTEKERERKRERSSYNEILTKPLRPLNYYIISPFPTRDISESALNDKRRESRFEVSRYEEKGREREE